MDDYRSITVGENDRRRERLEEFRTTLEQYILVRHSSVPELEAVRSALNKALRDTEDIVIAAGVSQIEVRHLRTASIDVNLFVEVFSLRQFDIPHRNVIDRVERAIGVYERDHRASKRRTWNPLWWFSRAPFYVLRAAGFDTAPIEFTLLGRALRSLPTVVVVVASTLAIVRQLGVLG